MAETEKHYIGVVAAEVNSIEQREIVKGIIRQVNQRGSRTVVFSNLYNPYEYDQSLDLENRIYELIFSPQLRGLILISESFTNEILREKLRQLLAKRQDIPLVIIGIYVPALAFPNVRFVNSSDEDDIRAVADHLIEAHGFSQIDILTGMENNGASEARIEGYKKALEAHGITYDPARVHYGNFWIDSGEQLAARYVKGELPLPEAVLCANDYMAYGMLDTFLQHGIRVPEDVTVTGYEFIRERIFHSPLLSTYERGRAALGETAAEWVHLLADGTEPPPLVPPKGEWVAGGSCPCGIEHAQLHGELELLRTKQMYDKWNVLGTLEQQLTLCGTLNELIDVLAKHHYWVRWVQNMFLCLCDNWYDTKDETPTEWLSCRSVMPWNCNDPPVRCTRFDFTPLFWNAPATAVHYYLPLFFEKHFFGYFVLEYHAPDTYDDIFRNWMKSISIGLTFLCMKNDIRYLIQCQNLSDQTDSLTGLYNQRGTEAGLSALLANAEQPVYAVALRLDTPDNMFSADTQERKTALLQKAAEVFRIVGLQDCVCGRIDVQTIFCAGIPATSQEDLERIGDKICAVLLHHTEFSESEGAETFVFKAFALPPERTSAECFAQVNAELEAETARHVSRMKLPHADKLIRVRASVYTLKVSDTDKVCRKYSFSAGYFRQIYKDFFGISFHQDVIRARIFRSMYLLTTTVQSAASIAEACGYEECNYFLRQFQKVTGMTPGKYRRTVP